MQMTDRSQTPPPKSDFVGEFLSQQEGEPFRFDSPFETKFSDDPPAKGMIGVVTCVVKGPVSIWVINDDPDGPPIPAPDRNANPAYTIPPPNVTLARLLYEMAIELEAAHLGLNGQSEEVNQSRGKWKNYRDGYWERLPEAGVKVIVFQAPDSQNFRPQHKPPPSATAGSEKWKAWRGVAEAAHCIKVEQEHNIFHSTTSNKQSPTPYIGV
jgi:hypothetical protein